MTAQSELPGPLSGLRVVELANYVGQWCGKLMADFGADVIKVEPLGGAEERQIGPFYHDEPDPERSLYFWHYNTSKRSVAWNLEHEGGRELFRRLVSRADVVLETLPPGELASIGLGYESLSAERPQLVMCSLTPFGQDGPWRDYRSSDLLHLAAGGQMAGCGYDEVDDPEQQPIAPGGGNAWHIGSHFAYIAIMAALLHRQLSGDGQYIDCSVHQACALTTEAHVSNWVYSGRVVRRQTGRHAAASPTLPTQLPTSDGGIVNANLTNLTPDRLRSIIDWMDRLGKAGDLVDPRYREPQVLEEERPQVAAKIQAFIASITTEEAYRGAQQAGMPWGVIRAPEQVIEDRHFHARGFFTELEHPELGETFSYPGAGAIFPKSPWRIYRRAPLIGEHNAEVCGELGLNAEELTALRSAGTIR